MDDFLDDILSEPSAITAPARKFQPKAKPRPKKGSSSSVPSVSTIASKEQLVTSMAVDSKSNQFVHPNEFVDKNLDVPNSSSFAESAGTKLTSFSKETSNLDKVLIDGNPSTEAKSSGDGHLNVDTSWVLKFPEDIIGQSTVAADWPAEKRAVKFQPKPKAQSSRKMDSAHVPDSPTAHPENQHMKAVDSIHVGELDTISKLSHVGVDGDFSMETSTAQPDTLVLEDKDSWMAPNLPEESGKQGNSKMSDALNFSHESLNKGPALSGIEANKNEYVFLDGENEGFQYNSSSPAKVLDEPTINRHENDEEVHLGGETSKKKRQQKPKTVASKNDKPARKRRKQSKAPDESAIRPPKKFPQTTRRKRSVDKSLLEGPEDEIDFHTVPIRDLIILAEYKERQAKKEAAVLQPPSTNERNDNTLPEDLPYDDEERFGSDQDTGSMDNPSTTRVVEDVNYFNYQTHMKRTQVRWSKQETELFYQGVRQFGTDLSFIAELFPGRDREQIKLKYKKEERQHPMRLNDALSSRAKDYSHFELVIQRLQERRDAKERAEQDQMSGEDNSFHPGDEEEGPDEGASETHETQAKSEQNEDGSAADHVASPAKLYDSEDDFKLSAYNYNSMFDT